MTIPSKDHDIPLWLLTICIGHRVPFEQTPYSQSRGARRTSGFMRTLIISRLHSGTLLSTPMVQPGCNPSAASFNIQQQLMYVSRWYITSYAYDWMAIDFRDGKWWASTLLLGLHSKSKQPNMASCEQHTFWRLGMLLINEPAKHLLWWLYLLHQRCHVQHSGMPILTIDVEC